MTRNDGSYIIFLAGRLQNWVPVCKSKCKLWRCLAKLNATNMLISVFSGTYKCKLEFTKPNKLHASNNDDKIGIDQVPVSKKGHENRRWKDLRNFRKINFHPCGKRYGFRMAVLFYFFRSFGVRLMSLAGIWRMSSLARISSPKKKLNSWCADRLFSFFLV